MAHRSYLLALFLLLAPALPAQDAALARFVADFTQAMTHNDEKGMDKALRAVPERVFNHFQALCVQRWNGDKAVEPTIAAIRGSWARCFEDAVVLEKVERWVEAQSPMSYRQFTALREALDKCYGVVAEAQRDNDRPLVDSVHQTLLKVARGMEELGHRVYAAEAWSLIASVLTRAPGKTLQDRKESLFALERFLEQRKSWNHTKDAYYTSNEAFAKAEREGIALAQKEEDKRRESGYDPGARGVDALVMPGAVAEKHALEYSAQKDRDLEELDYSAKGGPVPGFWWEGQFVDDGKEAKLGWFQRTSLYLVRLGSTRFGVSPKPDDKSLVVEADAGSRPKVTQFFLDDHKSIPYAMWFWTGGERERLFEVDVNLQWSDRVCPVFYRSAASWHASLAGETVTFYDDNADGLPCGKDPWKGELKVYTLGDPGGSVVPLLDSMRIGKGPRVPYSEFVTIGGAWYHLAADDKGAHVGVRPLNPEFFKTGRIRLKWDGPKPTAPEQLVIQGRGTFATAFFDIASQKDLEVPAGEYEICFGRIVEGKGARTQMASLYKGSSERFQVEPGKVLELKMGAPFRLEFQRGGGGEEVTIDGTRITLRDRTGVLIAELHNMVLAPEVLAARTADGKGAKTIARFVKLDDPEMLNKAFGKYQNMGRNVAALPFPEDSKDGSLELRARLPFADAKVGLLIKKHPLFGKLESEFR